MSQRRTTAERYFAERLRDPAYGSEYQRARDRIDQVDAIIRGLDQRREVLRLTKAELARRAEMKPEAIRRLFSAQNPNPTLSTLVALACALGLELRASPRRVRQRSRSR